MFSHPVAKGASFRVEKSALSRRPRRMALHSGAGEYV